MFQKYTLKNGMRVVLAPMHETKAVTILALFRVGSRYEARRTLGISHFLEHMMFKGTKKRPKAIQISRELDGVGAEYNAFTGKDYTGYYIKLNFEKAKLAMDMMSDMLANSLLAHDEVERERKVIQEEINMYEDNPMMLVEELYEEELYTGSSLGWRIAGDAKSLVNIKQKELVDFRKEHYRPKHTVLAVAGRFPKDLEAMIQRYFGVISSQGERPEEFPKFKSGKEHSSGPRVRVKFRKTDQAQVCMGLPAYPYGHERLPALHVLATILGGGMSSRLFVEVRERRGLAYFVRASVNVYQDTGNLMIHSGIDKSRIDEALSTIGEELRKMATRGITTAELARAKENMRGRMTLALEESSDVADFLGKQELLTNRILTADEKMAKVMRVTREDVQAVAKDILRPRRLAAAVIGPFKDSQRFTKILDF